MAEAAGLTAPVSRHAVLVTAIRLGLAALEVKHGADPRPPTPPAKAKGRR